MHNGLLMAELSANDEAFATMVVGKSKDPIGVLALAKTYDLRWSAALCEKAIDLPNLQLLEWLHEHGCPWKLESALLLAARVGSIEMLQWLRKVTGPWSDVLKKRMLWHAGCYTELSAVKWLRDTQDAAWPENLYGKIQIKEKSSNDCWPVQVVRWALANGCEWGTWRCQQLAAKRFMCQCSGTACSDSDEVDVNAANNLSEDAAWLGCIRQQARVLRLWAHKNGCPCMCCKVMSVSSKQLSAQRLG
jgi:hypothetical protein